MPSKPEQRGPDTPPTQPREGARPPPPPHPATRWPVKRAVQPRAWLLPQGAPDPGQGREQPQAPTHCTEKRPEGPLCLHGTSCREALHGLIQTTVGQQHPENTQVEGRPQEHVIMGSEQNDAEPLPCPPRQHRVHLAHRSWDTSPQFLRHTRPPCLGRSVLALTTRQREASRSPSF